MIQIYVTYLFVTNLFQNKFVTSDSSRENSQHLFENSNGREQGRESEEAQRVRYSMRGDKGLNKEILEKSNYPLHNAPTDPLPCTCNLLLIHHPYMT